jgi:hypothetical protein
MSLLRPPMSGSLTVLAAQKSKKCALMVLPSQPCTMIDGARSTPSGLLLIRGR